MAWAGKRRNPRILFVLGASLAISALLPILVFTLGDRTVNVSDACLLSFMGFTASLPYTTMASLIPIGSKGFRLCRKMVGSFHRLKRSEVASSDMPQSVRSLHTKIKNNDINGDRIARLVFKKGGPELALDFLRLCAAFEPLKGKMSGAEVEISQEMEQSAARILECIGNKKAPLRKFSLHLPHKAISLKPAEQAVLENAGSGDVLASLLGSGISGSRNKQPVQPLREAD